ncbi:MAG TPA: hypothetical protein VEQ41_06700 [Solirubrobacterales bacterium]|nr:hypothetical protein [Solirubrobacterales bacterium]
MVTMRCHRCEKLLQYGLEVVAVYKEGGTRRARVVIETTPGTGEADRLGATAKYHRDCYEEARQEDGSLPLPSI